MDEKNPAYYIAIEGVIGVGKTTLARMLRDTFNTELLLEVFEENPFLSDFYGDRARYAFQTQVFFLLSRYHQQNKVIPGVLATGKSIFSDYTFDKDSLFAGINVTGDELAMYHRVHEALAEKIPQPDLVVYLRASVETLMQRIRGRDRTYERNMETAYIKQLAGAYDTFFSLPEWKDRLIVIETDHLNPITHVEDLTSIVSRIQQTLHLEPYQQTLPL